MDEYRFTDALTGRLIDFSTEAANVCVSDETTEIELVESIFFPGCSLLNFAPALVQTMTQYLIDAGSVQGASFLCCGKILDFEENGKALRGSFDDCLVDALSRCGVRRIVVACPNCAKALRRSLSATTADGEIEIVPLSQELARLGCAVSEETAARLVAAKCDILGIPRVADDLQHPSFWLHSSCPDRPEGAFWPSTAAMLPEGVLVNDDVMVQASCCGSLARAAGKFDLADKQGVKRCEIAREAKADAVVVSCVSCAASLSLVQNDMPVFHYLELLCSYPIDWRVTARPMDIRFLLGADTDIAGSCTPERTADARGFIFLDATCGAQA